MMIMIVTMFPHLRSAPVTPAPALGELLALLGHVVTLTLSRHRHHEGLLNLTTI